jgi:class 3 adenylate cyclase/HAMP domain-containing protein
MFSRIRASIAIKMTLLVLGSTAIIMGLAQVFNYTYSRKMILAAAEKNARNLSLSIARRIEQEFRAVKKVPESLADYLYTIPAIDETSLLSLIRSSVTENSEVFASGIFFEPDGFLQGQDAWAPYYFRQEDNEIKYLQLASPDYDYFQKEFYYITRGINQPYWSDPYFDTGGGEILMATYAVPLFKPGARDRKEGFRGVVTADISLKWLNELVGSVHLGENGFGFIISDTGIFVSHPDEEIIMQESIFSIADKLNHNGLRKIGRTMIRTKEGFMPIGLELAGEEAFLAYAKIPSTGWSLGVVMVKSELFAELDSLHQKTIVLAVIGGFVLFILSIFLARSMARPLITMAGVTRQIAKGNLSVDLSHINRSDEVGRLAISLGEMVEGLKQKDFIRDTFGRYLTKEVVTNLLESKDGLKLGGEAREITLMMSDLRGFTALTANMPPEEVISFLNRYLGRMVEILMAHRGVIDEIIGDGILAFFGAPEPMEDHTIRAVACALEMQAAMVEINALNEKEGLACLEMGVAVHRGTVVVGNIGSEQRSKYGAVGSDVNFTGRMESYTVGGQVLISQAVYEELIPHLMVKETLNVQMKGIPGSINLYDIHGMKGPYNIILPERDELPVLLGKSIGVGVSFLNRKIVDTERVEAKITHTSHTSAVLQFSQAVRKWENLCVRLSGLDQSGLDQSGSEQTCAFDEQGAEFYGKIVQVTEMDSAWKALVRITSFSPGALGILLANRT